MEPIVIVHGGAGDVDTERIPVKIAGVKKASRKGYDVLLDGGSVVDAVEAAVREMENDVAFNAGCGAELNIDGEVQLDALIMDGETLNAGAVTFVKDIANPVSLARIVMEKTPHVLFAGEGANKLAEEFGIPKLPPGSLVTEFSKTLLEDFKIKSKNGQPFKSALDTVGAVAIDRNGNLAAATSTGGTNGKMVGRSSDASQIGSGGYADNEYGAVSSTGHGETIAKYCLAHTIINNIASGKTASEATSEAIKTMTLRLGNIAGAITLSRKGEIGIDFSSDRMAWAYQKGNEVHYGVEHGKDDVELVD